MKYLLFLMAACLAAAAAFQMGSLLYWRLQRVRNKSSRRSLTLEEMLEDPAFMFVALAAVSGVAAVAFSPWAAPPCLVISAFVARKMPGALEKRRRDQERARCEQQLDMLCDIVAMGVEAGLSFDAALGLYCSRFENEISRRMSSAYGQWSHGIVTRSAALEDLAAKLESPPVKRFADTVARAVEQGAPLAGMLRKLAVELRQSRKTSIERQVARAPVKMLVPTGVCILPAMLLLVMGPMLLQFMGS